MRKSHYNTMCKTVAVFCLVSILLTSCTTSFGVDKTRVNSLEYINADCSGDNMHKINEESYTSVCTSGFIELLFDEATATIAIRDNNTKKVWNTLVPDQIAKTTSASAVEIAISNGDGKIYTLNSQDNSVNFGNFSYTIGVDQVSVNYALSLTKEMGAKDISKVDKDEIRADLTVIYRVKDGSLYVNLNMNSLSLPKDVYLESVTLLNNFGAYEIGGENDYIFVPDGSGALMMTSQRDDATSNVKLSVYGENPVATKTRTESDCLLGAFGLKNGENAFLCIIEKGDAIAQINANRNSSEALNSVNASFATTEILTKETEKKTTRYYGYQYKGEIELCYRFLSGKSATYSGMATACRENLIRNSILPAKSLDATTDYIPLVVTLQAGCENEKGKYITLSNYQQALSLTTLLKAKGVNGIYLCYKGLYDTDRNTEFNEFIKKLGNAYDYENLYNYINSQKFSLFIDTNLITTNDSSNAKGIDGKAVTSKTSSPLSSSTATQKFLKMETFEKKINTILDNSEKMLFDGYSLNDIGKYLYSDYSNNSYSKNQTQTEIFSQLPVLSTSQQMMIEHGNLYTLKGADVVSEIPVAPLAHKANTAYVGVPFIQMLIHGMMEYSTDPLNTAENPQDAFLKAVEYGCLPSAYWYCTEFDESNDRYYYYNNNINDIVAYYLKANGTLSTLRDSRMTSHEEIQSGVYCTEYDNSTKVYVNYTNSNVTIQGVVIGAKDCVTIT